MVAKGKQTQAFQPCVTTFMRRTGAANDLAADVIHLLLCEVLADEFWYELLLLHCIMNINE